MMGTYGMRRYCMMYVGEYRCAIEEYLRDWRYVGMMLKLIWFRSF